MSEPPIMTIIKPTPGQKDITYSHYFVIEIIVNNTWAQLK